MADDPYAAIGAAGPAQAAADPYAAVGAAPAAARPDAAYGYHTYTTGPDGKPVAVAQPTPAVDPYTGQPTGPALPKVNGVVDVAKSGGSGLLNGGAGILDMANPFSGLAHLGEQGLQLAGHGDLAQKLEPWLPGGATAAVNDTGLNYQPQTTAGRYTKSVAEMVPAAATGGEGLLLKAAGALVPGVVSQGGRDATAALGGDQGAQDLVGGVLGIASGVGLGAGAGAISPKGGVLGVEEAPSVLAVQKALKLGQSAPDEVRAGMSQGILPVATSPGLAGLGEVIASTPGPAGVALKNAIAERMGTQTDRALEAVQGTLGVHPDAARGNVDAVVDAGRKAAAPLYDQALATSQPVWNPDLAELASRPAVKKAMNVAATGMLNRGQNPRTVGFALDPDTGWTIPADADGSLSNVEQQPTAELWDRTYKALGQSVDRHPITGKVLSNAASANNADISAATGDLRAQLAGDPANGVPGAIPGYANALAKSSDYLSVQNAFDRASGKLFTGSVNDFGNLWKSLGSDPERQAAQSALANDVLETADRNQNGLNPGRFRAPGVQKKLTLAFGPDAAQKFVDQMESDAAEKATYNQITGNSRTTPRAALIAEYSKPTAPSGFRGALQNTAGLADTVASLTHPVTAITHTLSMLSKAGGKGKPVTLPWDDPDVATKLGGILTDPDQMEGVLGRIQANNASVAQATARRPGILGSTLAPAVMLSGVLGPAQGAQAQQRQGR